MKKYIVGGWVRDKLLGKEPHDKDYVVVGSTPEEMLSLGFKQVGKDFPVFLHPETNDEYALARTERKTGNKHTDFEFDFNPNITLEEDLRRRDCRINAIAYDEETGEFIDPFNGKADIDNHKIRIIDENYFKLDPLRVLRLCRFSASLNFGIDDYSMQVMSEMVDEGMLKYLTPERIWKETEKALIKGANSAEYFYNLKELNAFHDWFPELYDLTNAPEQLKYHASGNSFKHTMIALTRVKDEDTIVKFAVLCHDLGKGNTPTDILPKHNDHDIRGLILINSLCDRLKVSNDYRNFAKLFCAEHMRVAKFNDMKLSKQYDLVKEISDGFKNAEKMENFLKCFYADYFGEWVASEYSNPETFYSICTCIRNIFNTMKGITLKDLPEEHQLSLAKQKGEKFGLIYREYMLKYLRNKLFN